MRRLILFLVVIAVPVAAVGVANRVVDPFGFFYSPEPLAAALARPGCLLSNDAVGGTSYLDFKLDILRTRPETKTVVVGSSRVLKLGPTPGEKTFSNLGMPGGSPDSLVEQFRRMREVHREPLTVYLGVEFMWLNPSWANAEDFHPSVLERLEYVLSRPTLEASLKLLRRPAGVSAAVRGWELGRVGETCVVQRGEPTIAWRVDGVRMYSFELDPALPPPEPTSWNGNFADFRAGQFAGYHRLDQRALERLADALDLARSAGWRVVGFAPPDSSRYAQLFATHPETAGPWAEFHDDVSSLFRARGFNWLALQDIQSVPCGQNDFVDDGWHVNAMCAARVRARLDAAAATMPPPG